MENAERYLDGECWNELGGQVSEVWSLAHCTSWCNTQRDTVCAVAQLVSQNAWSEDIFNATMREVAYCRKSWQNNYWDSSFVRVSVHWLLVLLSLRYPTTHLLALVSNNGTHSDATLTPSSFTTLSNTTQIIALASISLVCGHFHYGTMSLQWAIINCSTVLAWPIFIVNKDD